MPHRPLAVHRRLFAAIAALALTACGGQPLVGDPPPDETAVVADAAPATASLSAHGIADATVAAPTTALPRPTGASGGDAVTAMLVRRGDASVEVDSLEPALAAVARTVAALGGSIGSSTLTSGAGTVRRAVVELRLPAPRYEEALAGLRPLGTVEAVQTTVEDVGEEYVDLDARTANARRLETRLVELLARRTGTLDDVLAVERELARIREEIERHEGRMRFLRSRAAVSVLSLTLHEPVPLVGADPEGSVIGAAFVTAWRNGVEMVAALIALAGSALPIAVLVVAIAVVVRRLRRRAVA
ncbi:MAG: DUF4349 domain-containing protein [Gemmatimonadaceae bacterium]|jgi:hypothetical protein|nr:DUF4349 domain-containing protein [Gemmatimonadaceae bacterium]